jgi:hypothetical protein
MSTKETIDKLNSDISSLNGKLLQSLGLQEDFKILATRYRKIINVILTSVPLDNDWVMQSAKQEFRNTENWYSNLR